MTIRTGLRRRAGRRAAAVLAVGCLLLVAACSGEQTPTDSGAGYVTGTGALTRVAPADREPAPVVSGPELGTTRTLSTAGYAGKVVVVNVWASWCPPCRAEAKGLQRASEQTADVARFVGINSRELSQDNGQAFVRTAGLTYPSVYDPDGTQLLAFRGLSFNSIPSTIVIDAQGRVAARALGSISEKSLVGLVGDVAAGR